MVTLNGGITIRPTTKLRPSPLRPLRTMRAVRRADIRTVVDCTSAAGMCNISRDILCAMSQLGVATGHWRRPIASLTSTCKPAFKKTQSELRKREKILHPFIQKTHIIRATGALHGFGSWIIRTTSGSGSGSGSGAASRQALELYLYLIGALFQGPEFRREVDSHHRAGGNSYCNF